MSVDATQFRIDDDVIVEVRATIVDGAYGLAAQVGHTGGTADVPLAAVISARHVPPEILARSLYIDRSGVVWIGLGSTQLYRLDDPTRVPTRSTSIAGLRPAKAVPVMPE